MTTMVATRQTFMFNPYQARVPKHLHNGGEWVDTPLGLLKDFKERWGDVPRRAPVLLKIAAPRGKMPNEERLNMELQALYYYTADKVHYDISEELRHGGKKHPVAKPDWDVNSAPDDGPQDIIAVLDAAVHRMKTRAPTRLYRGMSVPKDFEWHPGDLVTDKCFVSMTDSPEIAQEFADLRAGAVSWLSGQEARPPIEGDPVVVEVMVPVNTFMAPGSQGVQEWILPRDTVFRVIEADKERALMEVVS